MNKNKTVASCPCGSGKALPLCCESIINGTDTALTAEALMRSRYTAYTLQAEQYLLNSWHSTTRPESIVMEDAVQWLSLKIVSCDATHVEFIATYRINGKAHKIHENSRFVYEDGSWFYVDGETRQS